MWTTQRRDCKVSCAPSTRMSMGHAVLKCAVAWSSVHMTAPVMRQALENPAGHDSEERAVFSPIRSAHCNCEDGCGHHLEMLTIHVVTPLHCSLSGSQRQLCLSRLSVLKSIVAVLIRLLVGADSVISRPHNRRVSLIHNTGHKVK